MSDTHRIYSALAAAGLPTTEEESRNFSYYVAMKINALATKNTKLETERAALLDALKGYERMSEIFTAISNPSRAEVEKLQTALKFVAPATRAAIESAEG